MVKWDGHTHSIFCRHGQRQNTAKMVEKAISLGFKKYSIVEHAPLPRGVLKDDSLLPQFGLLEDEVEPYLSHVNDLKRTYSKKIDVLVGMEVDYFAAQKEFTRDLLDRLDGKIEDLVFSIHFLPAGEATVAIDFSPEEFKDGLIQYYGDLDSVYSLYWRTVEEMVTARFKFPNSRRLGHLGIINKFFVAVSDDSVDVNDDKPGKDLFKVIRSEGWSLDFNVAGYVQPYWQKPYVTDMMLKYCHELGIPLVYGSDAHGIADVGRFYETYNQVIS